MEQTPYLITINEFADRNSLSRSTLYRLLAKGELKSRKVGGRTYISSVDAADWINGLPLRKVSNV